MTKVLKSEKISFWSFHDLSIGGAISSPIAIEGAVFTGFFVLVFWHNLVSITLTRFLLTSFGLYDKKYQPLTFDYHFESMPGPLD